jgi:hypothetical protein
MNDLADLTENLIQKSPAKRLKFLRQKILKKNQNTFCEDGIIRSGTLKSVETEKLKISPRIAERLVHKFRLEGLICSHDLFLEHTSQCLVEFDDRRKHIIGNSTETLEDIRVKLRTLTPVHINQDLCPSLFPNGATALAKELIADDLPSLKRTLCLVQGSKVFITYLTYENDQITASLDGKIEYFPTNIINFCELYAIEIVYFTPPT